MPDRGVADWTSHRVNSYPTLALASIGTLSKWEKEELEGEILAPPAPSVKLRL